MDIDVQKIQCAGVSFTEGLGTKYMKYYEVIRKHYNKELTYAELQKLFETEIGITNSATRVDIPFLFNSGLVGEYKNDRIKLNDFFTDLGKCFYEILKIKELLSENEDEYLQKEIEKINNLIILDSLFYRKLTGNDEYYLKMLRYIYDYGSIDDKEFYLMIKYEDDKELLEKYRDEYKNKEIEINLINANNTYQYTKRLLVQANAIIENKEEKRLFLNIKMKDIIEKLLK